jgi:hypothetical protein
MSRQAVNGWTSRSNTIAVLALQSLKRFVDPKDIAALCHFLASDASNSISGQVNRQILLHYFADQWNVSENAGPYCVTAYCTSSTTPAPLFGAFPVSIRRAP